MANLRDCFTQDEWKILMEAKEMVGRHPVQLEVSQSDKKATHYKLRLGKIELNGDGYEVATALWPDTESILRTHFKVEE